MPTLDTSIHAVNDIELQIALYEHRGIRSCTQYTISSFVSYNNPSLPYHTFLSKQSFVYSPKCLGGTLGPKVKGSNAGRDEISL
jgi:hypothetical protein